MMKQWEAWIMDKCPMCSLTTSVARGEEKDGYIEQTIVCTNPRCTMYSGKDLGNPRATIGVKKTKIE